MDISKWTDEQLMAHGWSYEQIRYQRSLEAPASTTIFESRSVDSWTDEIQSRISQRTKKSKFKVYVALIVLIGLSAYSGWSLGWF